MQKARLQAIWDLCAEESFNQILLRLVPRPSGEARWIVLSGREEAWLKKQAGQWMLPPTRGNVQAERFLRGVIEEIRTVTRLIPIVTRVGLDPRKPITVLQPRLAIYFPPVEANVTSITTLRDTIARRTK